MGRVHQDQRRLLPKGEELEALTGLLSFRNVVEEPFSHIERSPLGPKARSALHLAQGRQQCAIEFPSTFASHRSLDMEPVMGLSNRASDETFDYRPHAARIGATHVRHETKFSVAAHLSCPCL